MTRIWCTSAFSVRLLSRNLDAKRSSNPILFSSERSITIHLVRRAMRIVAEPAHAHFPLGFRSGPSDKFPRIQPLLRTPWSWLLCCWSRCKRRRGHIRGSPESFPSKEAWQTSGRRRQRRRQRRPRRRRPLPLVPRRRRPSQRNPLCDSRIISGPTQEGRSFEGRPCTLLGPQIRSITCRTQFSIQVRDVRFLVGWEWSSTKKYFVYKRKILSRFL